MLQGGAACRHIGDNQPRAAAEVPRLKFRAMTHQTLAVRVVHWFTATIERSIQQVMAFLQSQLMHTRLNPMQLAIGWKWQTVAYIMSCFSDVERREQPQKSTNDRFEARISTRSTSLADSKTTRVLATKIRAIFRYYGAIQFYPENVTYCHFSCHHHDYYTF